MFCGIAKGADMARTCTVRKVRCQKEPVSEQTAMLREIPLICTDLAMPKRARELIDEGLHRSKTIDCFDFVPSNYEAVYAVLGATPRGRFCEWGSGMGIVTGLAEMLGFESCGIEINAELASSSRRLLGDFGLSATIETGDYFEICRDAEVYFTYCWPGQMPRVEEHFLSVTPGHARLLICHGAEDIRCKVKPCMGHGPDNPLC